jgi:DNA-binding HxlR family transcriptional regulator
MIADSLELIGERWALLIVRELFWENHRFEGIAAQTGGPRDILSARLKRLTEEGIIERRQYSERPPRSEYHLTERGRGLLPVLMAIQEWGHANVERDPSLPEPMRLPHHDHGLHPVSQFRCSVCGEEISAGHDVRGHQNSSER